MRLLLIGCGAIGKVLAGLLVSIPGVEEVLVYDRNSERAREVATSHPRVRTVEDVEPWVSRVDIVVEAASPEAVRTYGPTILKHGKPFVVLSSAALMDEKLRKELVSMALDNNTKVYVPSGAIGGIDLLRAAKMLHVHKVSLTSRKPWRALHPMSKKEKVWEGAPGEAVTRFPRSMNIAATVALAMEDEKVDVKVLSGEEEKINEHRLRIEGDFGSFEVLARNVPTEENPSSSLVAALSTAALVKRILSPIEVGT